MDLICQMKYCLHIKRLRSLYGNACRLHAGIGLRRWRLPLPQMNEIPDAHIATLKASAGEPGIASERPDSFHCDLATPNLQAQEKHPRCMEESVCPRGRKLGWSRPPFHAKSPRGSHVTVSAMILTSCCRQQSVTAEAYPAPTDGVPHHSQSPTFHPPDQAALDWLRPPRFER